MIRHAFLQAVGFAYVLFLADPACKAVDDIPCLTCCLANYPVRCIGMVHVDGVTGLHAMAKDAGSAARSGTASFGWS